MQEYIHFGSLHDQIMNINRTYINVGLLKLLSRSKVNDAVNCQDYVAPVVDE
jgi:hypothetical protein